MRLPARLLRRKLDAQKRDFGHIFILAGSLKFSGAAVLCAEACLRAGAGLVTLGLAKSICLPLLKIKSPEIMLLPLPETKEATLSLSALKEIIDFSSKVDVLVIGPGLTRNRFTQALIRKVVLKLKKPMVIDADGLNALAGHLESVKVSKCQSVRNIIFTPHRGEMTRLLRVSVDRKEKIRKNIAKRFAKEYNIVLALKGYKTIVTDGKSSYINKTGNPGMSSAGSGDVLTGIIAAFLGQGLNAFDAAKFGVYLHGKAGDLAAKTKTQISMIASDIIDKIPEAVKKCSLKK